MPTSISRNCRTLTELLQTIREGAAAMSGLEVVAVGLAIAYLVLAVRQNIWCWPAAVISCVIYAALMYQAGLYMESLLQLFYIGMAVYGWRTWRRGVAGHALPVRSWPLIFHLAPVLLVVLLTLGSGYLLSRYSEAALPYTDSFTTWAAVITTWMVAQKILQNWHYWFVIDSVSVYMYLQRELYLTSALFCLYLVLIVIGYVSWRRSMVQDHAAAA